MRLTDAEFESILADETKRVRGGIAWKDDEDHSPAREFRVEVESASVWPLFVQGRYNPEARTLSCALILRTIGRIYALDLGKDHHNPQCVQVGEKHKHRWSERYGDKKAFEPEDVTASATEPVAVWEQFCAEARIRHDAGMERPLVQRRLW